MTTRVLVVNNHDSFVHTLIGYLRELGAHVDAVAADAAGIRTRLADYDALLLSPGPGTPAQAGDTIAAVGWAAERRMPLLGVCLGHQAIGAAFGTPVTEAPELMHGMVSPVHHDGSALFDGIPEAFAAGRYHSLALAEADLPSMLRVTARTEAGTVMAIEHTDLPIWGVQFHPESVLTAGGYRLLANWLHLAGDADAVAASAGLSALRGTPQPVQ